MTKYQFTFTNPENKYKPITVTLIPKQHEKIKELKSRAVQKACIERRWTIHDFMYKYGYTRYIWRTIKTEDK